MIKYDSISYKDTVQKGNSNIKKLAISVVLSYGISIILLTLLSAIVTYTSINDSFINPCVTITKVIGIVLSGSLFSVNASSRGWIRGAVAGMVYTGILILTGILSVENYLSEIPLFRLCAMGLSLGALGGIIGINFKNKS